jgi:hypothetical protein
VFEKVIVSSLALEEAPPAQLSIRLPFQLRGTVHPDATEMYLRVVSQIDGSIRRIDVDLDRGSFDFPLILQADEIGPYKLFVVSEFPNGGADVQGEFDIEGIESPVPFWGAGVLALSLLPDGSDTVRYSTAVSNPSNSRRSRLKDHSK